MSRDRDEHWGVIPWQPWAKKRPRISRGGGRTHQDPADREAEGETREWLKEAISDLYDYPFPTNVAVRLKFYRRTAQVVDLDNLVKHFMDSANGVLFVDDRQVTKVSAELHLDREFPRTEWWIKDHTDATMIRDLSEQAETPGPRED